MYLCTLVGIHYPSLVSFFFFLQTNESLVVRGTWIILKKCTCSEISVISLRERRFLEREGESLKREGVSRERERDESTQAEIRKGRIQAE